MSEPQRNQVMISSTALDLPEHRQDVIEAVLRQSCIPRAMETLTAANANAIEESLRLVDQADVYLGIFAHRYGWVPPYDNPDEISITEMEYNRAVERDIPRLIFFIDEDVAVKPNEFETGTGAEKLKQLKQRIGTERVAGFFSSPKDLRGLVIQALAEIRKGDVSQLHYVSAIPAADAFNLLAEIERIKDEGGRMNHDAAIEAARQAYRLSWLQGPPFCYARGLTQAAEHLDALGAEPPGGLPPYDESQYEPMPDVEIDKCGTG